MVEQDLRRLSRDFDAALDEPAFAAFDALHDKDPKRYKTMTEHPRIYPLYFAPIMIQGPEQKLLRPMRYRVRPYGSAQEVPSSYNMFNARLDGLEQRRTWSALFMRHHGILVAQAFFEWVERDGKKSVIRFAAREQEQLLIPVIYDYWSEVGGKEGFYSFALITSNPTPEVLEAGHDRLPIILSRENSQAWLNPKQTGRAAIKQILARPMPAYFEHTAARP
jgi:putative SOS response-associated peptidase YedK